MRALALLLMVVERMRLQISSKITIQKQPIHRMIISKKGASRKRRGGLAQGGQLAQVINNLKL